MANVFTSANFEEEVLKSDVPVLVDFWASWCMPCKMLAPVIEELAAEATDYKVGKVDVDQEMDLAQKYRVMSIPTVIVFKKGQAAATSVGVQSKDTLKKLLAEA